jgi:hypothetical protein
MATVLDILVLPTYSSLTLGIVDASTYDITEPVTAATIEITPPGFDLVSLPFNVSAYNVYTSSTLGITSVSSETLPLPDGIYYLTYSIAPAYVTAINKSIMRIEQIQEKFDRAFMKLDMIECDRAIKTQAKVDLGSVYFFIQGAVAAANNCAVYEANKLYITANKMLDNFIRNNCGCSGNNYTVNFS